MATTADIWAEHQLNWLGLYFRSKHTGLVVVLLCLLIPSDFNHNHSWTKCFNFYIFGEKQAKTKTRKQPWFIFHQLLSTDCDGLIWLAAEPSLDPTTHRPLLRRTWGWDVERWHDRHHFVKLSALRWCVFICDHKVNTSSSTHYTASLLWAEWLTINLLWYNVSSRNIVFNIVDIKHCLWF